MTPTQKAAPQESLVLGALPKRKSSINRQTSETDVSISLNLSPPKGEEEIVINTSIGFFDHMLTALARFAGWSLVIKAKGDTHVDYHHTVEDVGLVLGEALAESLGDYSGHHRFGSALVPMDEALVEVAIDAGRRPYLHFEVNWPQSHCHLFDMALIEEFWRAVSQRGGLTLHICGRHGRNSHHLAEALFKGAGVALSLALAPQSQGTRSTKGVL
ncbi:MAG: imidazoleglycerol-phosphate dehydratase HisB [Candidatus Adiutrix sp.]